jgi:hypothetical protein
VNTVEYKRALRKTQNALWHALVAESAAILEHASRLKLKKYRGKVLTFVWCVRYEYGERTASTLVCADGEYLWHGDALAKRLDTLWESADLHCGPSALPPVTITVSNGVTTISPKKRPKLPLDPWRSP